MLVHLNRNIHINNIDYLQSDNKRKCVRKTFYFYSICCCVHVQITINMGVHIKAKLNLDYKAM